jgi:transposase-like protein
LAGLPIAVAMFHPTENCCKYLNNLVEQDHRFIKRLTKPGLGFGSFNTARQTLKGFEAMNMIRKGQVQGVAKGDVRASIELVSQLFGIAQ